MKKKFICLIMLMMLFMNTSIVTSANSKAQLTSVELFAGENFSLECDMDKRTITLKNLNITAKYSDNTEKHIYKHVRTELVHCEHFAVIEIYSDPDFSFKFTFIPADESITKFKLTSAGGSIAKYTVSNNEYSLTCECLSAQLTYIDGELIDCPMLSESETTALSANNDFYISLDNALIYRNNFTENDESIYNVDFFKTGQLPNIAESKPERYGYTFIGWYSDKEYTKEYDFQIPLNRSTVIFAKWEHNLHNLTVINGSGGGTYAVGDIVTINAVEATNKLFSNWTVTSNNFELNNYTDKSISFIMPDSDIEITASYTYYIAASYKRSKLNEKAHYYFDENNKRVIEDHEFGLNISGNKLIYTCHKCGYSYTKDVQGSNTAISITKPAASDVIIDYTDIAAADMLHAQRTATGDSERTYKPLLLLLLSLSLIVLCRESGRRPRFWVVPRTPLSGRCPEPRQRLCLWKPQTFKKA